MQFYDLVVVGGGMSAMSAIKTFRAMDSVSSVLMLSDQPDLPIRKPPLSKQLWSGGMAVADVFYNPSRFKANFLPRTRISQVDFRRRMLTLSSGEKVRYNQLLLATGLTPVMLPGEGAETIYFNTLSDYKKLKMAVGPSSDIVVLGGGLLAVELAAALQSEAGSVKLAFPGAWPLDRYLPSSFGSRVISELQASNIECLGGRRAKEVASNGEVYFEKGDAIRGDIIVPVIGQRPSLSFLDDLGIDYQNGLMVEPNLRVKGLDDVFACGDIIRLDGYRERCPHEENALRSGALVGRILAGAEEAFVPSTFLYSEFLGMRLESIGFGKAKECQVAAERWENEAKRGMAVLSRNNEIERLALINYQIDPSNADILAKRIIGKKSPENSSDLIRFVMKSAA